MLILSIKVVFERFLLKFLVNFHYILASQKQLFSKTIVQWLLPKTIMLLMLQKHITIFPFHALLVPKTKISDKKKKRTTSFWAGKNAQHMLISSTDSRLNMLMNVMLIKKTYNYSLIPVLCDNKKKEELEVTIFDENQVFCKKKSNF